MSLTTVVTRESTVPAAAPAVPVLRPPGAWRWLAAWYAAGLVFWLAFLYIGAGPSPRIQAPTFRLDDGWYVSDRWFIHMQILDVWQQAVRTGQWPYHVTRLAEYAMMPTPDGPIGQRLFSVVYDWPLSPQVALLAVLDPPAFVVVNWLLWYSVGFAGCVLIQRRYRLGPVAFAALALLFHANGLITANASAAMSAVSGYFVIPYVVLAFLSAADALPSDRAGQIRRGLWIALGLAVMWMQGSAHVFIQWLTFLGLWGVVNWRQWRTTVIAGVGAVALCAVRVLPAAFTWGVTPRLHVHNPAMFGFWVPDDYVRALAVARRYVQDESWVLYDLYVGWPAAVGLLILGLWGPFTGASWVRTRRVSSLLLPAAAVALLSFRRVKQWVLPSWLPLFNAEVYTSRYMLVPLTILIIVAAINLQGVVEERLHEWRIRWTILGGLGATALALVNHARLWRLWVAVSQSTLWEPWRGVVSVIANEPADRSYLAAVHAGAWVSVLSLATVVTWLVVMRKMAAAHGRAS